MTQPLPIQIRNLLTNDRPFAYCDACLALRLSQSLETARAAAKLLAREDGFTRTLRVCYACQRSLEMTEAGT